MKIAIILANGFEEIEAVAVIDVLRRANLEVQVVGLSQGPISSSRGVNIVPDIDLNTASANYDMLILPGGMPGTTNLANDPRVTALVNTMNRQKKYLAAICAAPLVLSQAGILMNKRATCHPSVQAKLQAREVVTRDKVVVDENIITSQGPGTAIDFALQIVALLQSQAAAETIRKAMIYG